MTWATWQAPKTSQEDGSQGTHEGNTTEAENDSQNTQKSQKMTTYLSRK